MNSQSNNKTPAAQPQTTSTQKSQGVSYKGKVQVNFLNKKNKIISSTTYHNNGCYNLFNFLAHCLTQDYNAIEAPQRIVLFKFDVKGSSPLDLRWDTGSGQIKIAENTGTPDSIDFIALTPALTFIGSPSTRASHGDYSLTDYSEVSLEFKISGDLIGTDSVHAMALYNGNIENKVANKSDDNYVREALAYYYFQSDPTDSTASEEIVEWAPLKTEAKDFIIQIIWTLGVQN